ncbi:MAG: UDP-N-acetylmuramate dehydrogenase [Bacteroidaceae bacterium]|nr:UDP-N-acetylmuramate dehydrogenase [Bacteroidaceae bacterium]
MAVTAKKSIDMIKEYNRYSLLPHNTFGIEAEAAHFVEFGSEDALVSYLKNGIKGRTLVIGAGSNLVFVKDFDGTVFHSAIKDIEIVAEDDASVLVRVGSGVVMDDFVAHCVERGWYGIENLSLIPGEVGASAVQNVGAYGVEAGDFIEKVEAVRIADAEKRVFMHDDCRFAYRYSVFKDEECGKNIVTYVTYRLSKIPAFKLNYGALQQHVEALGGAALENVRRAVCEIREAKLPNPATVGSAGSFFMNPIVQASDAARLVGEYPLMPHYPQADGRVKLSAGWLIEQCGWKDTPHEHVGVYRHQALVVINRGGATGAEVLAFANEIVASVKEKFGVRLNMEANIIE